MRQPSLSLMSALLLGSLAMLPAQAHKTEVSGDVAGTWHLEPNHSPKAGEPARVWVALTQQGGQVIPLEQCDCALAIYATNQPGADPVMQPPLEAISPERFQNIPGANITFPAVGEYRIALTGRPKGEATFTPFELSYTTVVAIGNAAAPQSESTAPVTPTDNALESPTALPPNQSTGSGTQRIAIGAAVLGVVGFAIAIAASRLRTR
ncbi:MAG: hypothetical protein HLUCCA11_12285 [Phormidesmis priestleyi Ana]|uniref:Transketolase n=1 Tax=Phormidesmis priestleyi Ana TaxID=1666911 RepID=A0A0P7YXI4_9CYAN|nr:MAG: hypothetical protein HLUCCA11_12285 [Phormidesmis priestleyi Ana]